MKKITVLRELKRVVKIGLNSEIGLFIIENDFVVDSLPVITRQRIKDLILEGEHSGGFADPHTCAWLGGHVRGMLS